MKQNQESEINRLRRELIHSRDQLADLQEELQEKHTLYINAISERDKLKEQWKNTKESINRVENIVQSKVDVAMARERSELQKFKEENHLLLQRMEIIDREKDQMNDEKRQLLDKINGLNADLAFYTRNISNLDAKESMKRLDLIREEKDQKEREIVKRLQEINELNNNIEDLMAENRILRKMANVPDNYGKNLVEQIKLHDREKIEDYKKLIRVLQDDNYKLEEERAKLKHMLKQQSMMYKQEPSQRYKGLAQEQIFKVDQYVMKLLNGETEDHADFYKLKKENQNLKAQLEAVSSKGFEFVKNQIGEYFKGKGMDDSSQQLDKLLNSNEEIVRLIRALLENGVGQFQPGQTINQFQIQNDKFRPPVPRAEYDGSINNGYSYKFNTELQVVDQNGNQGIGNATRYDCACYQLQLQECLEIIKRKDENLSQNQTTIEMLYRRIRDYLLVQDQLYKDYVSQEKDFNKKQIDIEQNLRNTKDALNDEQMKVEKLQSLIQQLNKGDKQSIEQRLIELTKLNSILDVNLIRLTRKYQTLEQQEELLRREYHNKDQDFAEKDRFVQDRINKLKEWKARAIQQLNYLFQKLKCAVPLTEYQKLMSQSDLIKQKNADLIDRNARMAQKQSKLQTQIRQNMEFEERYKNLQELKEEAENELEIIKKRLEQIDENFKWENAIFNKIVEILKRVKISPQQAFQEFDSNKDGKIDKSEFLRALDLLKISDLTNQEVDILINSLDISGDGRINYQEFVHKLSRHGIRSRTTEEQIIYLIIEALKRSKIKDLNEAFELMDKEQRGFISKDDFKDIFRNLGLKIDQNDLDKFIDQFWKDKTAGIDYQQFLRIFQRYQVRLDEDKNKKQSKYIRIPEEIIKFKKDLFVAMQKALTQQGKTFQALFRSIDVNNSDKIDLIEFKAMFEKMKVTLTTVQAEHIFNSIDFDNSGEISSSEFISDFNHYIQTDIDQLFREEKQKAVDNQRSDGRQAIKERSQLQNDDILRNINQSSKQNNDLQYQTRIAILEAREKQSLRKLETCMRILKHAENAKTEISDSFNSLEKKWFEMTEQYHIQKSEIVQQQEMLSQSILKTEAEKIKLLNEKLNTELVETRAAMLSYKQMTEVIADQVKNLKLQIERKKDENENLFTAVRELQSQSVEQQRLGKLYYVVMLSRWQEAAVNKKYDMILTENKELRKELLNQDQLHIGKDNKIHECENQLQEKQLKIEKQLQVISSSKNMFLSLDKAHEFNSIINNISEEKNELEEQYFKMRSEFLSVQLRVEDSESKAEHFQELLNLLDHSKQSELSDKVIELSMKMKGQKQAELRAVRMNNEANEKLNHLQRQLKIKADYEIKLEEQVADIESRLHKKEEEFRRADNERMRKFFNAKYDNLSNFDQQDQLRSSRAGFQPYNGQENEQMNTISPKERSISVQPNYIDQIDKRQKGYQGNNQQNEFDIKTLEGQIKRLKDELKGAIDQLHAKDLIINRFKEWQLADTYLSQDSVLKDAIDKHSSKAQELHEQESKDMSAAAVTTIKSLHQMIDSKTEQIKHKEEMIEKLHKQLAMQREQDQNEIFKLQKQLSLAGDSALSKMQEIIAKNESHKGDKSNVGGNIGIKYERMSREELQRAIFDKDQNIHNLSSQLSGLKDQYEELYHSKKNLINQNQQLEQKVYQEQQNNQLKANKQELEDIKRKLKLEAQQNEKLSKTIQDLNMAMQKITKDNVEISEDQKMNKIQENTRINELNKQVQELLNKSKIQEVNNKKVKDELKNMKIKEQERVDNDKKLTSERDEARKSLGQTRDQLEIEIKKRQALQIDLNNLRQIHKIGSEVQSGPTFEQIQSRNKELENDILILQCQQKTVIVYNKETATFEYIGEPILLNFERELTDIEDIIDAIRNWVQKNERLTIKSIFESMDKENFGELTAQKFDIALSKIGIKLREKEKQCLKNILDPKNLGYFNYRPLIKEISGIKQLEFFPSEIIKFAKFIEVYDMDRQTLYKRIDPLRFETMTINQFRDTITQIKTDSFELKQNESENIFKYITKSLRTEGVTLSVSKLCERIFSSLIALLIEQIRDALFKSMKSLSELFQKYDVNRDGFLSYAEFENLLLEIQIPLKQNMIKEVLQVFDLNNRQSKISYQILKFYLSDNQQQIFGGSIQRSLDFEPQKDRLSINEDISIEEFNMCRIASRKILSACQNNLPELLNKKDVNHEGLISREDVSSTFEELKISEFTNGELNLILKYTDKGHKGYIAISNFLEKLQELAIETKQDIMLRRFGASIKHQGINIKFEMQKFDQGGKNYKLDRKMFSRAMKQLSIALTDEEIELLFQSSEIPEQKGFIDTRVFIAKVLQAQKSKPLPTFIAQPPKLLSATSKVNAGQQQSGIFENWEVEKKYKKKLEALQQQIEESKKETQAAEKQSKNWQEMANKFEKEKNALQTRLVDLNAKPPKAAMYESLNQGQLEQMQNLKDQLFYLQEQNNKLEKTIQVDIKTELGRMSKEKEILEDKLKHFMDENKKLEYQISRLHGKPMDQLEKREEAELWRENKIKELEEELTKKDQIEQDTNEHLLKAEEKLLDLKFQKETFDLQYARLQKRITDLEQYKLASSNFSAVLKKADEEEQKRIEEVTEGTQGQTSKKQQESVKMRSRSTKSVVELEMVIESLKRVIEKQKTQNGNLQKQLDVYETQKEKLKSEKALRQKIENLEQEVHSYEMKDVNLDEKDKTIRKLIESNKIMREDLRREAERYNLLEKKYKDVLVKYNILSKDHASKVEKIFSMGTGGNIHNYESYLLQDEAQISQKNNNYTGQTKYDRNQSNNIQGEFEEEF